jgi:hypothetical protein
MKNNPMFLLPTILVLVIGGYLVFSWWRGATDSMPKPQVPEESYMVDERGQSLLEQFGATEDRAIQLKAEEGVEGYGVVQWSEDKSSMTVLASLAQPTTGRYQAWVRSSDGSVKKLGTLRMQKAGYILDLKLGTAVNTNDQILVSLEGTDDQTLEKVLLVGVVPEELGN